MKSLAVKYRPVDIDSIVGQSVVKKILNKQLLLKSYTNSYIFSGQSGSGKTTAARAFANGINHGMGSPIEIDGASNNGVDNVREIISVASERSIDSEYKVFIIDEAHQLSSSAWNAFLKTIEEPPHYTIFIFCTTLPEKIPETISNRCMRLNFSQIPQDLIYERLKFICNQEGFTNYDASCDYLSRISNGCMRDAISMLERVSMISSDISIQNTLDTLGDISFDNMFSILDYLIDGSEGPLISELDTIFNQGINGKNFINRFTAFCFDILSFLINKNTHNSKIPNSYSQKIERAINFENSNQYYSYLLDKLLELKQLLKDDLDPNTTTKLVMLNISRLK